jgi:hypothetical protein
LSAGVVTLLVSIEQKSVQLKIPVELVMVMSCKQITLKAAFATFAVSVLTYKVGCVPVVFVVILAIVISP